MNKTIFAVALGAILSVAPRAAADNTEPVIVKNATMTLQRADGYMTVNTDYDLSQFKHGSNRELWIRPAIANGADTLWLAPIMVAGHNRYYQSLRFGTHIKEGAKLYKYSKELTSVPYSATVTYQNWMNGGEFLAKCTYKGCCGAELEEAPTLPVLPIDFRPVRFEPKFNWIAPQAEAVKHRELTGRAFVDFPVNLIVIYPDYRGNRAELAKIKATIDSVHNDRDITITKLTIKGYASPEGPYDNNIRLAKGRTAALKTYVEDLYRFAPGFIQTSYEPEDWEGLEEFVEKSNMVNREGILRIIHSNLEPDAKNSDIERTYPDQYRFLHENVYPALRHSDYTIEYNIKGYSDVEEIKRLVKTRPQNLSLQEFYLAANSCTPGSPEYNDIFETAVRMYPHSEIANLNAANAAMERGDLVGAARYLDKAGEGGTQTYARGILAAMQGDYSTAADLFSQAARAKVADAPEALRQVKELAK